MGLERGLRLAFVSENEGYAHKFFSIFGVL
jgi:hypothetical protein